MLKIILADNQAIFRAGIAKVLAVEDDIRIVAQASSLDQLMSALENFQGSILLFSSSLAPNIDQVVAKATANNSRVVVIAETGEQTDRYVRAGFHGIAFRSITGDDLLRCVRAVAHGERYLHDVRQVPISDDDDSVGARVRDRLTPKELKIVALIVQGYKNKEIAIQLGTTEQVVKNYLRNVYDKIGVSDRLELALFTIHHRILAEAAAATAAAMAGAAAGGAVAS